MLLFFRIFAGGREIPRRGDAAKKGEGGRNDECHPHDAAAVPIHYIKQIPREDRTEKDHDIGDDRAACKARTGTQASAGHQTKAFGIDIFSIPQEAVYLFRLSAKAACRAQFVGVETVAVQEHGCDPAKRGHIL